jgi:hypothetical protein
MAARYKLVPEQAARNEVLESIGKRYRKKAEILIKYLSDQRKENGRIIYEDGELGSHLVDLIKYFVYPEFLKLKRPADAVKFALLLKHKDVPESVLGRSLVLKQDVPSSSIKWRRL